VDHHGREANVSLKKINPTPLVVRRKLSKLKRTRLLCSLTLSQLSLLTGIDIARISRIENGFLPGNSKERTVLSSALGCAPTDLFSTDNEK
jgi:transcriptional regulator with XRE-family HTH domain